MRGNDIYVKVFGQSIHDTKDFKEAWSNHNGKWGNQIFQFADDEYGKQEFMVGQMETSSIDMMLEILKQLFQVYDVDVEWWPKRYSAHFYSPDLIYNFIIRLHDNRRIAYRVENDICFEEEKYYEQWLRENDISEMVVIHLSYPFDVKMYDSNIISTIDIKSFFAQFFDETEWESFSTHLENYLSTVREILGFKTVSFLSSMNLKSFKQYVANELKDFPYDRTHYQVIDHNNAKTVGHIELETKDIDSGDYKIINKKYINDGFYDIMVGNSNFAKSFLTSEWLYHSLKGKPNFDYTSVISGYAKAVEQLLYTLITRSVDINGLHISLSRLVKNPPADICAQIKEETGKTNTFRYIPLTKDNIAGGYIDDSLWSLQTFINKNSWYLEVSGDSARMLYEMIDCFRIESRNEYFHKENLYNWDIVEKTRSNAIYLFYLVIGSYPIDSQLYDILKKEKYDKFDELCMDIREFQNWNISFAMKFNDDSEVLCLYDFRKNCIEFTPEGQEHYEKMLFIKVEDFTNETYEKINNGMIQDYFYISRQNMPTSVYGIKRNGERQKLL